MPFKVENKNLTDELERLARLHAEGALTDEEFASAKSRVLNSQSHGWRQAGTIRRQSSRLLFGLPLWAIAIGPDYEKGEMRGHARAIFALGDIATGYFACGGMARGVVAFGGLAIGVVALGGAAIGGLALGGGALGVIAFGGGACGYYAFGGGALGVHSVSAVHRDPAALELLRGSFSWAVERLGG